ncbi:anti-sigma factor family protein [Acidobacteriota bacterium]
MRACKYFKKNSVAFLSDEIQGEKKKRIASHLDKCPQCRFELDRLKNILNKADSLQPGIEKTMASIDWEALPFQISETVFKKRQSPRRRFWIGLSFRALFSPRLSPIYAGLFAGIFIGALITFFILRAPHITETKIGKPFGPEDFIERVELEMARREAVDFLDKSRYLLLDFVQSSSETPPKHWQSSFALERTRDLLSKKKYFNNQLDEFQMAKAKEICDQIEFLLYELAEISDSLSSENMKEIQSFIQEKQLLLKIKLLKSELEESEV